MGHIGKDSSSMRLDSLLAILLTSHQQLQQDLLHTVVCTAMFVLTLASNLCRCRNVSAYDSVTFSESVRSSYLANHKRNMMYSLKNTGKVTHEGSHDQRKQL